MAHTPIVSLQTVNFQDTGERVCSQAGSSCSGRLLRVAVVSAPQRSCTLSLCSRHVRPHRQALTPPAAIALSYPPAAHGGSDTSPFTGGLTTGQESSNVIAVHSPEEFAQLLKAHSDKLVCLMAKARGCRPCKMFSRKYQRIANQFEDCVFAEILGDESRETRKMMIEMKVTVTPTFRIYYNGTCVHTHGGINESNLRNAIITHLKPGEAGYVEASPEGARTAPV